MWKLDFYLLTSRNYNKIGLEEALNLQKRIEDIKKTDEVYVPDEFYVKVDEEGRSAEEFLFSNTNNDIIRFLQETVMKQKSSCKTYGEIDEEETKGYVAISRQDIAYKGGELCVWDTEENYNQGIVNISDVIRIKRMYLLKSVTYKIYQDRAQECFPKILFHVNSFLNIKKLGKISEVVFELNRHLAALNDYGKRIYEECNQNEENALRQLQSKCGIICSGKGSNETQAFKSNMLFEGKEYTITCNSHTKFYSGNNDQRIYFSWGREKINKHMLIIISIGPHWDKIRT